MEIRLVSPFESPMVRPSTSRGPPRGTPTEVRRALVMDEGQPSSKTARGNV